MEIAHLATRPHATWLAALLLATSAQAADLSAQVGTTGAGIHLKLPLHSSLDLRLGLNGWSYSGTGSTEDAIYDYRGRLRTADALVDWYPTEGTFRITGGLSYNGNRLDLQARPREDSTFVFRDRTYNVAEVGPVVGEMSFRRHAPYLGIGWGRAPERERGWGFSFDLGAMFQGQPRLTLTPTTCASSVPGLCDQFRQDVQEEEAELREKTKDFTLFPVVRIGLMYRF
jgi:hypothetical protein